MLSNFLMIYSVFRQSWRIFRYLYHHFCKSSFTQYKLLLLRTCSVKLQDKSLEKLAAILSVQAILSISRF